MQYGRPPTGSLANRPGSRAGAGGNVNNVAAGWRGGIGVGTGVGVPPRTAMPNARPGTASRNAAGGVAGAVHVVDRPITQQGLGGMKTALPGSRRMVQDKTFFLGELRHKITLLTNESNRLNGEVTTIEKENNNLAFFEKKADTLADELRELQGQLGDLNMLVEKLHTDTELDDLDRQKENAVKEAERLIEEERKKTESLIKNLPADERNEYFSIREQNETYVAQIQKQQFELDQFATRIQSIQAQIHMDPLKEKAAALYEKLGQLRAKKLDLETEVAALNRADGPEERERLLRKVKDDNLEISSMERKIGELDDQIKRMREQIAAFDSELEASQGEKNAKYEELLRRDKEMQAFIDGFDAKRDSAASRNRELEAKIVALLDEIKLLSNAGKSEAPTTAQFKELQGDLKFKEKEMKNSENTVEALLFERERHLQDLEKVNQLEGKLNVELTAIKSRMAEINAEMAKISNVDAVKKQVEDQKRKNAQDKISLAHLHDHMKSQVTEVERLLAEKKQILLDNETYNQLNSLEQKMKHHESSNFQVKEYIAQKQAETNYQTMKDEVTRMIDECNTQLLKIMSLPPAR